MLIVNFKGGLGNQMFQYAFYKSLKEKYPQTQVKMLNSCFDHNGFELDRVFGVEKNTCSNYEAVKFGEFIPNYIKFYRIINILNYLRRIISGYKKSYINQINPSKYMASVYNLDSQKSFLLDGYWQNPRYYNHLKDELMKDFQFENIDRKDNEMENEIISSNSVSLHIRRGDYLKIGFPVLTSEYYSKAIEIIMANVENPKFFIFSDDPIYAEDEFSYLNNYKVVKQNKAEASYMDMYLMTKCKHNIIANSSFSFWGAYLNTNSSKIVVAPNKIIKEHSDGFSLDEWEIIKVFSD
ncbi:MAG: alpha-1,2-fucosyltransferase [Tissierellales bacterium]|nr:alpha-1,2-fucosyltransferase [Candidatus Bathyarchaeota archaeon]MBN2828427.1 alpha-1,2-fucosyltransferase [Tissierellales bacterium]